MVALKLNKFESDYEVIDPNCNCLCCKNGQGLSKSALHFMFINGAETGTPIAQYLTHHNIIIAIKEGRSKVFVRDYIIRFYGGFDNIPKWLVDALKTAGVTF
ncbi:tRNA-guanine(15) transglycosylase-like domain-containing protein [Entamoeba marina]